MTFLLSRPFQRGQLLNVNIPKLASNDIKGMRVCRQADARWVEKFVEGHDPSGHPYYWLTGEFINYDHGLDTDIWALENGYVSVVPAMHDLTNHEALSTLSALNH